VKGMRGKKKCSNWTQRFFGSYNGRAAVGARKQRSDGELRREEFRYDGPKNDFCSIGSKRVGEAKRSATPPNKKSKSFTKIPRPHKKRNSGSDKRALVKRA